nr:MAG TPA: hypothetical protein [Caudoviricetes sp.]
MLVKMFEYSRLITYYGISSFAISFGFIIF